MKVLTLPGVFRPITDSAMLAHQVAQESCGPGARSLDLCTGSGIVALAAARAGFKAAAVDVSRRALVSTWLNAIVRGRRVRVHRGHLFEPVAGRRFHLVTANPPYVPSTNTELPDSGSARAWDAGRTGRAVIDEICDQAAQHLTPGGVLLLVHSDLCDEWATIDRLERAGLTDAQVITRQRGPLGPLMRAQQRLGAVPADVTHEDLVIVRAVAGHNPL